MPSRPCLYVSCRPQGVDGRQHQFRGIEDSLQACERSRERRKSKDEQRPAQLLKRLSFSRFSNLKLAERGLGPRSTSRNVARPMAASAAYQVHAVMHAVAHGPDCMLLLPPSPSTDITGRFLNRSFCYFSQLLSILMRTLNFETYLNGLNEKTKPLKSGSCSFGSHLRLEKSSCQHGA